MIEQESKEEVRNQFLGEIETEIVGMQYHKAKIHPGEQINLERESKNTHDRRAIRVENGHFEPVGYLPRNMASWLAPLIDERTNPFGRLCAARIHGNRRRDVHCPVNLMVFQCEKGRRLLEKAEPHERA